MLYHVNDFYFEEPIAFHKIIYICDQQGDVAQLARALGWQPRGRGFEPHLLHIKKPPLF